MKLIHLSDLHIGKRVNEFSMIEEQHNILSQILDITRNEAPNAVIIAGDVYDKSVPSTEAVELFDSFLFSLSQLDTEVFIISGNHDSAERLAFGNRFMKDKIHISGAYNGTIESVELSDEFGAVYVYLLPFIKPSGVRRFFPDVEINSYTDALRTAINATQIDHSKRNVIVTHQFVTGASRSESEELSVGGTDNVDAGVFDGFDYVALGHIHAPQNIGSPRIRYCGTPLKYSFSEAHHQKSVTIAELNEKGTIKVSEVPLTPIHDMVEIKGKYNDLMLKSFYDNTTLQSDYVHITLTDEEDIPNAILNLRRVYHNVMKVDYDNTRTRTSSQVEIDNSVETKTPLRLFEGLYEQQNGKPLTTAQAEYLGKIIEEIWEGEQ